MFFSKKECFFPLLKKIKLVVDQKDQRLSMLGALQPQREIPRATIVITHYFHYFFPIVSCFNQTNSRKTAKMASGGDDWDTVTYLRKKPQSASALKTDKVILERDILRSHLFYRAELYEASLS